MGYLSSILGSISDKQRVIIVGTGVLLVDKDNKVFVAQRADNNLWCLPGGSLELGETLKQCVVRETLEETNITVSEDSLVLNGAEAIREPVEKDGRTLDIVSISYWTDTFDSRNIRINGREFTRYKWESTENLLDTKELTPYSKRALEIYVSNKA